MSNRKSSFVIPDGLDPLNPVIIYTDGVFDVFHFGHARLLKQVKSMFKHTFLIVGVCSDEDVFANKGKSIMTMEERIYCIENCKWCDKIQPNAPWFPTLAFLDSIGAHYIAHDPDPYPYGDIADVYADFRVAGRFLPTTRTDGISTTDLIRRILIDKELFIERSLKKGVKPSELNLKGLELIKANYKYLYFQVYKSIKDYKQSYDNQKANEQIAELLSIWDEDEE